MKKRNLFVTLGLALGLGIAGLTAATLSSDKVEREVEAGTGTATNTMTIYLGVWDNGMQNDFKQGVSDLGIYQFTDATETTAKQENYVDMVWIGSRLLTASIRTDLAKMIFVRITSDSSFEQSHWTVQFSNNQTEDITFDSSKTFFSLQNWYGDNSGHFYVAGATDHGQSDLNAIEAGRRYYFDAYNVRDFWYNDSAKTYVVFYGKTGFYGTNEKEWFEMARIPNTDIHYVDLPHGFLGYDYFVARSTDGGASIGNQTTTVTNISDCGYVVCRTDKTDLSYNYDFSICTNDEMLYSLFAGLFLDMKICLDAGGLTEDAATLWEKAKTTYTTVYSLLVSKTYIRNSSGSFIERYNAVINKNPSYEDFMAELAGVQSIRVNNQPINTLFKEESNITIIIIAIAGVSLLAVAGFFLLKRKEDR